MDTDELRFSKAVQTQNISEHTADVSVWHLAKRNAKMHPAGRVRSPKQKRPSLNVMSKNTHACVARVRPRRCSGAGEHIGPPREDFSRGGEIS